MTVARGVRVVDPDGDERVYDAARAVVRDGYGDYDLLDARGTIIATRKRDTVQEIETLFE